MVKWNSSRVHVNFNDFSLYFYKCNKMLDCLYLLFVIHFIEMIKCTDKGEFSKYSLFGFQHTQHKPNQVIVKMAEFVLMLIGRQRYIIGIVNWQLTSTWNILMLANVPKNFKELLELKQNQTRLKKLACAGWHRNTEFQRNYCTKALYRKHDVRNNLY